MRLNEQKIFHFACMEALLDDQIEAAENAVLALFQKQLKIDSKTAKMIFFQAKQRSKPKANSNKNTFRRERFIGSLLQYALKRGNFDSNDLTLVKQVAGWIKVEEARVLEMYNHVDSAMKQLSKAPEKLPEVKEKPRIDSSEVEKELPISTLAARKSPILRKISSKEGPAVEKELDIPLEAKQIFYRPKKIWQFYLFAIIPITITLISPDFLPYAVIYPVIGALAFIRSFFTGQAFFESFVDVFPSGDPDMSDSDPGILDALEYFFDD